MRTPLALALALALTLPATAGAQRDSVAVVRVVEQVAASFHRNDPELLDRLTTDDYTFVTPTGAIQTKAQRLTPMRSGQLRYTSARYDQIAVRVYGTTAVATARVVVRARMGTADASGTFRATQVLSRIRGRWLMVASHASALAR
ncbi:MAG TPA: nuclear transport factor 2 family protein [Longimicrobium sp.]|nr:nuclear transport factor 2 family protein [Longimicrobium sp.]